MSNSITIINTNNDLTNKPLSRIQQIRSSMKIELKTTPTTTPKTITPKINIYKSTEPLWPKRCNDCYCSPEHVKTCDNLDICLNCYVVKSPRLTIPLELSTIEAHSGKKSPLEHFLDVNKISKIVDNIYLSGMYFVKEQLIELGITKIVRILNKDEMSLASPNHQNITYLSLYCKDEYNQPIIKCIIDAFDFINSAVKNNEKVLIHCRAGISRSATIVIGYLMKARGMSYNMAYTIVKYNRSIVSPNLSFQCALFISWAKQLRYERRLEYLSSLSVKELKEQYIEEINNIHQELRILDENIKNYHNLDILD